MSDTFTADYIVHEGRVFRKVTPVGHLLNSKLITDAINTGGQFVVDLDTGQLTIYRNEKKRFKKYVWWRGRGKGSRSLSNDYDCALVQIADEFALGYGTGRLYVDGKCEFDNADGIGWNKTVHRVREVYSK